MTYGRKTTARSKAPWSPTTALSKPAGASSGSQAKQAKSVRVLKDPLPGRLFRPDAAKPRTVASDKPASVTPFPKLGKK
ncbi:MAG: hypothetical protein HWE23_10470 [Rhodobacteraceae bacterium]|nr:hypothetical protein [Paracoccaceae bacterium]